MPLSLIPNLRKWHFLAENHPVKVTILAPKIWETDWLRKEGTFQPVPVTEGRFRVLTLPMTDTFREVPPDEYRTKLPDGDQRKTHTAPGGPWS